MKILFVLYHPVDPYIVFESARRIEESGGETFFLIVEKEDIIKKIVDAHSFKNKVIGRGKNSFLGKTLNIFNIFYGINRQIRKFKPNLIFSGTAPYTSFACKFNQIPLICWEDTETATFNWKYAHKRIDSILMVESFYKDMPYDNVIKFNGYKELAYLHPNVFRPDKSILGELGLKELDKIVLMRFSALNAMHDIGLRSEALYNEDKIFNFINKIEKLYDAKVLISMTERDLSGRFSKYKLRLDPSKYIHLLANCTLYVGEGTTTASEAGVLGVPWINIQRTKRGYLIDQEENYGLGLRTDDVDFAFQKAEEFLKNETLKSEWKLKKDKLINDKIDVSAFFTWFIMNYPNSHKIMKENPDFQYEFK